MNTVAKLIIGVRVIVALCKLINAAGTSSWIRSSGS